MIGIRRVVRGAVRSSRPEYMQMTDVLRARESFGFYGRGGGGVGRRHEEFAIQIGSGGDDDDDDRVRVSCISIPQKHRRPIKTAKVTTTRS